VVVSEEDLRVHRECYGVTRVSAVPTGVDLDYFRPNPGGDYTPRELVFTGSMDWFPNEDAIVHFAHEVLPRIHKAVPDVTLTIVGRNPPPRVRALAERDPSVRVTGGVPDVRPYLERAALFVVPLRIGGGTRLKIYEAMAMGRPVVSTSIGAEGLPLRDGLDLRLADGDEPFAAAVIELLEQPLKAQMIAMRGAQRVRSEFGWEHAAEAFARVCDEVAGERSERAAG
jgi:glycosyltransferase involved in cell wall biosynthesis